MYQARPEPASGCHVPSRLENVGRVGKAKHRQTSVHRPRRSLHLPRRVSSDASSSGKAEVDAEDCLPQERRYEEERSKLCLMSPPLKRMPDRRRCCLLSLGGGGENTPPLCQSWCRHLPILTLAFGHVANILLQRSRSSPTVRAGDGSNAGLQSSGEMGTVDLDKNGWARRSAGGLTCVAAMPK